MRLYEHEGKAFFKKFKIPVSEGKVVTTADEAANIAGTALGNILGTLLGGQLADEQLERAGLGLAGGMVPGHHRDLIEVRGQRAGHVPR